MEVGKVVLVAGPPGSGKTTLSRALAEARPKGLHLVSDRFYEFIPRLIDPSTPASRDQNHTIMNALGACAAQFAVGGYEVFLDGVIGPWMLSRLRPYFEPLGATHYVLLQIPVGEALARVRAREGPGLSPGVRHMNTQFGELAVFGEHVVDTEHASPGELAQRIGARLDAGEFRLDWSQVEP